MKESVLIEELKDRFGAEIQNERLTREEETFLKTRQQIYERYNWDFNAFVQHIQLIRQYALEDQCLEVLAWKIEHILDRSEVLKLRRSKFFKLFGEHKLIYNALLGRETT